jgi:exodeoxyribonuclease VII large subunit
MTQTGPSNREIFSVSELNRSVRQLLEGEFPMVFVEGEISNFTRPSSGHWYLTLKDDKAQLRCAMFVNRNRLIRFTPKNGMQVVVRGRLSLYEGRGEYQLIVEFMEEAGDGALRRAFDKLRAGLDAEGLFAPGAKQAVPALPRHLGVITSPTGAAIRDVLHVLKRRFPAIHVSVIPVQVQGEESVPQIVEALQFANRYREDPFDVLLLTRGGGSLEDLWSFNTEQVARAIFASRIPVVCAVGHETDFTIADFVADLRAPTPSAAAEMLSPDVVEWLETCRRLERTFLASMSQKLRQHETHLSHVSRRLRHPGTRLQDLQQRLDDLEIRMSSACKHYLAGFRFDEWGARLANAISRRLERADARLRLAASRLPSPLSRIDGARARLGYVHESMRAYMASELRHTQQRLSSLENNLRAFSHDAVLNRGYAIVMHGDTILRNAADVVRGDSVTALLKKGRIIAEVTATGEDDDANH